MKCCMMTADGNTEWMEFGPDDLIDLVGPHGELGKDIFVLTKPADHEWAFHLPIPVLVVQPSWDGKWAFYVRLGVKHWEYRQSAMDAIALFVGSKERRRG